MVDFAHHVQEHQRAQIAGMVCFLKFDQQGQLYLLKCTSIRTARDYDHKSPVPLNLGVRFDTVQRPKEDDRIVFRYVLLFFFKKKVIMIYAKKKN